MSDYRVTITIPGLPFEAQGRWEPFISHLEHSAAAGGPVLAWEQAEAQVLVGVSGPDEAEAARVAVTEVIEALHATNLGDRYPSRVELEHEEAGQPLPV